MLSITVALKLVVLLICLAMPSLTMAKPPELTRQIADRVTAARNQAPYPSLAVSVQRGDETLYHAAQGYADLEHQVTATPNTVYQIGSLTKSFTALLMIRLAEVGKIDLDAPVNKYLPDYQGPAATAPVRYLMNHTAGLVDYLHLPNFPKDPRQAATRQQMRELITSTDRLFPPGTAYSYSNSGTYLLGLIAEAVTSKPYHAALAAHVLEPLGLNHTYFAAWQPVIEGRAEGYAVTQEGYVNAPQPDPLIPFAAGALMSTLNDMRHYLDQVHRRQTFGKDTQQLLYHQAKLRDGTRVDYALGGIIIRDWEGHRKISHAGDIDGFSAYMAYYPQSSLMIAVLANTSQVSPTPVALEQQIARLVLGIPAPKPSGKRLQNKEIKQLTGTYRQGYMHMGIAQLEIVPANGGIAVRIGGQAAEEPAVPLFHIENRRFIAAHDTTMTFYFSPQQGQASTLTIDWQADAIPFHRFSQDSALNSFQNY